MFKIQYEIKLNEHGRPYIELPQNYENNPEDRFFVIELARYFIERTYARRSEEFDQEASQKIETALTMLGQIGDIMSEIIYSQMKYLGDVTFDMETKYHVEVKNVGERDLLDLNLIVYNDKIFKRQIGLKVLVLDENKIYELKSKLNNWEEVK